MMDDYSPGVGMNMECVPQEMKSMFSDQHMWRPCRTFFLLTVGLVLDIASFFVKTRLKIELEWPGCWPWMLYLSCGIHKTRSAGKRGQNLCLFSWLRTNRFLDLFSSTYCNYMYTSIHIIKRDGLKTFLKCYHDLELALKKTSLFLKWN